MVKPTLEKAFKRKEPNFKPGYPIIGLVGKGFTRIPNNWVERKNLNPKKSEKLKRKEL